MKNLQLFKRGIIHSFGVFVYIFLVVSFMNQASTWFGEDDREIITPIAMIMLFLFSALVTGSLVLAKPILLYIDGFKKEALRLFFFTGLGLFVLMIIIFLILLFFK